jgi:formate C-acetyltransferase
MGRKAATHPRTLPESVSSLCARVRRFEDEADPFLRGRIVTAIYRDEPDLPPVRKRAELLARTLGGIDPTVLSEERILGPAYRRFRVHGGVGDYDAWRIRVLFPDRFGYREDWPVPDDVHRELRWWLEGGDAVRLANPLRAANGWMWRYGVASPHGMVQGHTLPDYGILLSDGIGGLRQRIARRLERSVTADQRDQLSAMDRCLEGLNALCLRCAAAARLQASRTAEPESRERLLAAANDVEAIAERPPTSFAQALQLVYLGNFADRMDTPGDASSYGRLDQVLLPFYEADMGGGRLTDEEAFILVCCFLAKNWAVQDSHNITIGGLRPDGRDGTNPVSYLFIEAMEATELVTDISVRLHLGSPPEFVRTVMRVVRRGFGRPSLYNDDVTVDALLRKGVELEDARDYAPLGCVEVMIPGRSAFRTMCMGLNLPKVLELTLSGGRCLVTGDQVWDDVPAHYGNYEELLDEYHRRTADIVATAAEIIREDERREPEVLPRPWLSVLSRGAIESAQDITAGQPRYDPVGVTLNGLADIANSLCAVRDLVFEERRISLEELRRVLRDDWRGHDRLRRYVLERLPRFGQGNSAVDEIARGEAAHYARCWDGRHTFYGGSFWPMVFGVSTSLHAHEAPRTGAMPSGRQQGDALSMSLQPSPAGGRGAPTELLRSAAAFDSREFPGGISNVQEFDPTLFRGERGLGRLEELVRAFFDLGGMELSVNLLSEELLRAAQADPDAHVHVTVRLFGLSARFVDLKPELQDEIIRRVAAARNC